MRRDEAQVVIYYIVESMVCCLLFACIIEYIDIKNFSCESCEFWKKNKINIECKRWTACSSLVIIFHQNKCLEKFIFKLNISASDFLLILKKCRKLDYLRILHGHVWIVFLSWISIVFLSWVWIVFIVFYCLLCIVQNCFRLRINNNKNK